MKAAQEPKVAAEAPVRMEFQVTFSDGQKGRQRVHNEAIPATLAREDPLSLSAEPSGQHPVEEVCLDRLPKITSLLVLGHHFEKLVQEGVVKDYAEIARLTGLTRARVTQITNLSLLEPKIQAAILQVPGGIDGSQLIVERDIRALATNPDWLAQWKKWNSLTRRVLDCRRVGPSISSSRLTPRSPKHLRLTTNSRG